MKYLPIVLLLLLFSCKQKNREVTPAFYYWKSNFNPTSYEKKKLDSLDIQTLFVKFFDVAWDVNQKRRYQ
ncbi:hypothetical protein [Niabella ginsengisoli]|uniref:Uncharacterized protein n=1 Tax=Niabella ginsengisoli TaxID=522298 RepID=A0ABS9SN67_9BACT|nr:hypothetical protein [Niabella ginsengisoli]MCH5599843.1 hypothetical protein [Niabella ginsengisoli]